MQKHHNILVIGRFPLGFRQVGTCLRRAGYTPFALGTAAGCEGMSRHLAGYSLVPDDAFLQPDPDLAVLVGRVASQVGASLVIPSDLETTRWLGDHTIAGVRRFPCPTTAQQELMHDKSQLPSLAGAVGVGSPRTFLVHNAVELEDACLEFPADGALITKPINFGNGDFVERWSNRHGMLAAMRNHFESDDSAPRLIQQAIDGWDVDASGLAVDGRLLSVFTQRHHERPFRREFVWHEGAAIAAARMVRERHYTGAIDFGFRCDAQTGALSVIDCNPRFTASTLFKQFDGWNLPAIGAAWALDGVEPEWAPQAVSRRSTYSFTPSVTSALYVAPRIALPAYRPTRLAWFDQLGDVVSNKLVTRRPLQLPASSSTDSQLSTAGKFSDVAAQ